MIEKSTLGKLLKDAVSYIDPDLENFLPRDNTPTEYGIGYLDQLEQNLLHDKFFKDCFTLNQRPDGSFVLLDGYTRLSILQKHQDKFDMNYPAVKTDGVSESPLT